MGKETIQPGEAEQGFETKGHAIPSKGITMESHQDPEKHYIGDSLPIASDADLQPVGVNTTAGSSKMPARADHVHGIKAPWSSASAIADQIMPSGARRYHTTWTDIGQPGSENWLPGSATFFTLARPGLYMLNYTASFKRNVPANFTADAWALGIEYDEGNTGTFISVQKFRDFTPVTDIVTQSYSHSLSFNAENNKVLFWMDHTEVADWATFNARVVFNYISGPGD